MSSYKKYLFLDRDGTLIQEPSDYQIDSVEKFELLPDVIPSLLSLKKVGFHFVMVSNQDGLGLETYPQDRFDLIQNLLLGILKSQGIEFESILICPHFEKDRCLCRKPQLGLVRKYLSMPDLDRSRSFVIGDRLTDLSLAENMGLVGIQIKEGQGWREVTQQLTSLPRCGEMTRKTRETEVHAQVNLDSTISSQIETGVGFFDHMLEQLSHHGGFSLRLRVKGDLHIDDHHTIEDSAITLGAALRQALGDKVGIERFGFYLPMDDASARVTLDLSGRNFFKFEGNLARSSIGDMSTEMVPHFFRSFAEGLGANLHIYLEGNNTHHLVESAFKAVGRSLRSAVQLTRAGDLPSTKGVL
jgi:imidazoleglycerol-phosphate dehydratase/histidinol-phosphatase